MNYICILPISNIPCFSVLMMSSGSDEYSSAFLSSPAFTLHHQITNQTWSNQSTPMPHVSASDAEMTTSPLSDESTVTSAMQQSTAVTNLTIAVPANTTYIHTNSTTASPNVTSTSPWPTTTQPPPPVGCLRFMYQVPTSHYSYYFIHVHYLCK